ncbi:helix-turn-helix domain-containing protein [Atribacter laminatus]|uniref:Helix-turn-helix domain-containing protein n=1 Tax=Atribacter laminatus TaxID=2847778 RepID=A0A7T1ALL6_ATRLM|nr:helix-turn-helix domain-containing protein [Atribacter laminatus]QPM68195.1 hypothetical protein RT761_01410 [Atribacter laminatus]
MIFRVAKSREIPYVMLNKCAIYDNSLSFKAKGVLVYLLSRPDDWQIYESEIVKHSTDGKASVRAGIKELITHGYVIRQRRRTEKGKFQGYIYNVYEVPPQALEAMEERKYTNDSALENSEYFSFEEIKEIAEHYCKAYQEKFGEPHPPIDDEWKKRWVNELGNFSELCSLSVVDVLQMIDEHFARELGEGYDYNIRHFASTGILKNLAFQIGVDSFLMDVI